MRVDQRHFLLSSTSCILLLLTAQSKLNYCRMHRLTLPFSARLYHRTAPLLPFSSYRLGHKEAGPFLGLLGIAGDTVLSFLLSSSRIHSLHLARASPTPLSWRLPVPADCFLRPLDVVRTRICLFSDHNNCRVRY